MKEICIKTFKSFSLYNKSYKHYYENIVYEIRELTGWNTTQFYVAEIITNKSLLFYLVDNKFRKNFISLNEQRKQKLLKLNESNLY